MNECPQHKGTFNQKEMSFSNHWYPDKVGPYPLQMGL